MAVTPTFDILRSIGLRPRISFHSPMLQAFGWIVWQRRCWSQEDGWLRLSISVFCFLKLWTWCWQVHLSSFFMFPHDLPGPCCGLCRLSLCTLRLQAFGPQASEVPAWPGKKSYGKISHEIWQKIGSAKEKNRLKCQFLFEKNWCDLSSCPKRWPATIQNPNDFSCEVLLWLADLPLTDRGSCSPKKGPTSYSFFFWGEWNSWTLIHWGFSHIFVARMHINHINSQAVFYWEVPTFGRSMRPSAAP